MFGDRYGMGMFMILFHCAFYRSISNTSQLDWKGLKIVATLTLFPALILHVL